MKTIATITDVDIHYRANRLGVVFEFEFDNEVISSGSRYMTNINPKTVDPIDLAAHFKLVGNILYNMDARRLSDLVGMKALININDNGTFEDIALMKEGEAMEKYGAFMCPDCEIELEPIEDGKGKCPRCGLVKELPEEE